MECIVEFIQCLNHAGCVEEKEKEKDTLCTLRGLMIEITTSAKSLDIWYGDYCLNGKSMGVVFKK